RPEELRGVLTRRLLVWQVEVGPTTTPILARRRLGHEENAHASGAGALGHVPERHAARVGDHAELGAARAGRVLAADVQERGAHAIRVARGGGHLAIHGTSAGPAFDCAVAGMSGNEKASAGYAVRASPASRRVGAPGRKDPLSVRALDDCTFVQ